MKQEQTHKTNNRQQKLQQYQLHDGYDPNLFHEIHTKNNVLFAPFYDLNIHPTTDIFQAIHIDKWPQHIK